MKQLVVISGKGGTGKTSVVASFAALAESKVLADCDVDAADLHLVLEPEVEHREEFSSGTVARILSQKCEGCGVCHEACRFEAILGGQGDTNYRVDPIACEGCGVCVRVCPAHAAIIEPTVNGEWYVSRTRHGPMVHGRLGVAAENSGKLVTLIRTRATELTEERGLDLVIIDGSPGIGCPVIASVAGADLALAVTEPTLSGLHDLRRVVELARHFNVPTAVCVNKWDLNSDLADQIEHESRSEGLIIAGRIRYDKAVVLAQVRRKSVVEQVASSLAGEFRVLWSTVEAALRSAAGP